MSWTLLPPWSIRWIALAAVVLIAVTILRLLRERRNVPARRQAASIAMRSVVIIILLLIALNPTAVQPRPQPGKPRLVVLLDTSASMNTPDVAGQPRLAAALHVLDSSSTESALHSAFSLDVRRFDADSRAATLADLKVAAANGKATDIGSALTQAVGDLGDDPAQAGVLLISDGRSTSPGALDAARLALARSVPLWTWTLGSDVPRHDLWVEIPASEVLAFADTDVQLAASLHEIGFAHRSFNVQLLDGDRVIDHHEVTPDADGSAPVRFIVKAPASGEHRYSIRVPVDPGESQTQNNQRWIYLRSVGQKVRVLVVEGQPHWDTKFLVQSLKRNPRVDLTALYRLGKDREFAVLSQAGKQSRKTGDLFPRTAAAFDQYDVIILGRSCETFFDDKTPQLLTHFVADRGGSLVFSRGKAYSGRFAALAKFDPVVWGGGAEHDVKLVPTQNAAGGGVFEMAAPDQLNSIIDRLPRFDAVADTRGVKPLAVVLAGGQTDQQHAHADEDKPVVMAYQLFGQGRVVTLNASGLWRWSFHQRDTQSDEFIYDQFWSSLLRWLLSGSDFLAGHDVALRSDRRLYTDEQPLRLLIRTRNIDDDAYRPKLVITPITPGTSNTPPAKADHASGGGGDTSIEIEPRRQSAGTYLAEAGPLSPGAYSVKLINNVGRPAELSADVEVVSGSIENRQLSADAATMRQLADISQGRAMTGADVPQLASIVRQWRARRELSDQRFSLWDRWPLMLVVLALLAVEWFARRREGLL